MTPEQLNAAHAYAQTLALLSIQYSAAFPISVGDCANCRQATGVTLLLSALMMRCNAAPSPIDALDHTIRALQKARDEFAARLAQKGPPS